MRGSLRDLPDVARNDFLNIYRITGFNSSLSSSYSQSRHDAQEDILPFRVMESNLYERGDDKYKKICLEMEDSISDLIYKLKQVLLAYKNAKRQKINANLGKKIILKNYIRDICKKNFMPDYHQIVESKKYERTYLIPSKEWSHLILCVDGSASMCDSEIMNCIERQLVLITKTCQILCIPLAIIYYNHQAKIIKNFDKLDENNFFISMDAVLKALRPDMSSGTDESTALKAAATLLEDPRIQRKQCYMLFLTDGLGINDLPQKINDFKSRYPFASAVGVGIGEKAKNVKETFVEHHVHVNNISELPEQLSHHILKLQRFNFESELS